jgi:hypothetical protein
MILPKNAPQNEGGFKKTGNVPVRSGTYRYVPLLPKTMQAIQQQDIAYLSTYEIMSSRAVAQPPAGRFTPILGDNDLAYGSR